MSCACVRVSLYSIFFHRCCHSDIPLHDRGKHMSSYMHTYIFRVSCRVGHDAKQQSNNYVCRLVSRTTLLIYLFMIFVPIASFLLGVITLFQPFNYLASYTWRTVHMRVTHSIPSFVNDQRKRVCRFFLNFQKRFLYFVVWIKSNGREKNRSIEMDLGIIIIM